MTAARFITFEGGEGSGKSTQTRLLADRLRAQGHVVVTTREPGGTPLAEKIRDLILEGKPQAPVAELLLFGAARAEHLVAVITPALESGAFVICDRFIDSTRVYQGAVGTIDPSLIRLLEDHTVQPWFPALTIVLDVPVREGMDRVGRRGGLSRFDHQADTVHETIRSAFAALASAEPERCVLVNGGRPPTAVADDVWHAVQSRLLAKA
jgi:dTMP kinase